MSLEQLWNGWRADYVSGTRPAGTSASVFTNILNSGLSDIDAHIVHRTSLCFVIMNAFPYATGHMLVLPVREVANLEDLTSEESQQLWALVTDATMAVRSSHSPDALNVGINLGAAAGGSVSQHLHVHVVPRWNGDSNFMTSVASTRTLPEALPVTAQKIRHAWPKGDT